MDAHPDAGRTALSRRVCEAFRFHNVKGQPQQAGCLKALRTLESEGRLSLPAPKRCIQGSNARLLDQPVPEAEDVPASLRDIRGLELELVEDDAQRAIWNTLMATEHPQGATKFAGAQLRYLFRSEHGYLGAIGFAASALYLGPRDAWMAWSEEQRQKHLHYVVGLNRFLIRPEIRCKNLASHLLGKVLRRLPQDFFRRYGYRPWVVETFVGPDQRGTCFRAAGFLYVGKTAGRGRHARTKACTTSKKAVFVFELDRRWRARLGVPHVEAYPQLEVGAGLCSDTWAQQEFGGAPLGDKRRTDRLVQSVAILARTPGEPMTAGIEVESAAVKGYYRFIEKVDSKKVTPKNILEPHRIRTIERMRTQTTVLCVEDETIITYSTRPKCEGLEVIGRNQTTAKAQGVRLHATLALSAEGLPLGLLRCAYAPEKGPHKPATQRWVDGFNDTVEAASHLSGSTRVISVMDREGDMFAVFEAWRSQRRTHVLVRTKVDRILAGKQKLFASMRGGAPDGFVEVPIARLSRREKSGRLLHEKRGGRMARMAVRYRQLALRPTDGFTGEAVRVSGIHLREEAPPEAETPIEWYLLTTVEVTTREEALKMVDYYAQRWRIEDAFRVLKSGCKVEELSMQKASSLHCAITIYAVMAWRLLLMTLLRREVPEAEAQILFTDTELRALEAYAHRYRLPLPKDLASAILVMAILGGYMNRKNDPPPGVKIMWRGYSRLEIGAEFVAAEQYLSKATAVPVQRE